MAASSRGDSGFLQLLENNYLECNLCFDTYKKPKYLSCHHTFCEGCLTEYIKHKPGDIVCPTCRVVTQVPKDGGIPALQNNFLITSLCDEASLFKDKQVMCDNCSEDKMAAMVCVECAAYLCDGCYTAHQTMKTLRATHNTFDVNQLGNVGKLQEFQRNRFSVCPQHNEPMKLYCRSEKKQLCHTCSFSTTHDGHKVCPIQEQIDLFLADITANIEKNEIDNSLISSENKKLEALISEAEKVTSKSLTDIEKEEEIVIQVRVKELREKYNTMRNEIKYANQQSVNTCKSKIAENQALQTFLESKISERDAVRVIPISSGIEAAEGLWLSISKMSKMVIQKRESEDEQKLKYFEADFEGLQGMGKQLYGESAKIPSKGEGKKQESHDDDVIFLGEKNPTPAQEERAHHHLLPRTFYLHEASDFPVCRGCVGCDPDTFDFSTIGQTAGKDSGDDKTINHSAASVTADKENVLPDSTTASLFSITAFDSNLFGSGLKARSGSGLFGAGGCTSAIPSDFALFSDSSSKSVTPGAGLFGSDSSAPASGLIRAGASMFNGDASSTNIRVEKSGPGAKSGTFGSTLFGSSSNSNFFGDKFKTTPGAGLFGTSGSTSATPTDLHLFGGIDSKSVTPGAGLFGRDSGAHERDFFGASASVGVQGAKSNNNSAEGAGPTATCVFGSNSQARGFDFAAVAKQFTPMNVFSKNKNDHGSFKSQGAGATLVSPLHDGGKGENGPYILPIIKLPQVEIKTVEEDETVIYAQRSKLYRFDNPTDSWKERAVGEMKILRHNETGAYRLLMRREQVYKIACNHLIAADLKLTPMLTSETSWCWHAIDYSEAEPKMQQFAIRFKTKELAEAFVEQLTKCQQEMEASEKRKPPLKEVELKLEV